MKIVFFDSGVGGLSVLHDAMKLMPNEHYVYFADSENVPYGTKTKEEIRNLVFQAVDYFKSDSLKALVLACNTATSVVIKDLRAKFDFPIIGMEPAIKPASEKYSKRILVCATDRTIIENKLQQLIETLEVKERVDMVSLQSLVAFAENYDFNNSQIFDYLNSSFEKVNWDEYESLVLGCTHFLFFRKHLNQVVPSHVDILDGNLGTVMRLESLIDKNETSGSLACIKSKKEVSAFEFDNYIRYYSEIR